MSGPNSRVSISVATFDPRKTAVPPWLLDFARRRGQSELTHAAHEVVSDLLERAKAIDASRTPPVRLEKLLSFLGAQLVLRRVSRGSERGTLTREGDEWSIAVDYSDSRYGRELVAHELSHIILHWSESGFDLRSWHRRYWSEVEESYVDFLSRLLLLPERLIPTPDLGQNLARCVVVDIAGRNRTTIRFATQRMLELKDRWNLPIRYAIFWKQYHPLDDYFLHVVLRGNTRTEGRIRQLIRREGLRDKYSFKQALNIWRWCLGEEAEGAEEFRADGAIVKLRAMLNNKSAVGLFEPKRFSAIRPEWIIMTENKDTYIPVKRGAARPHSMAARLIEGDYSEEIDTEAFSIGALQGSFQVHGFAHGNATLGNRWILQILSSYSI